MLTLHGFAASNYYNIVKHCLLYKEIPFTENTLYPGTPELQKVSPAGKVPALTTTNGTALSESSVLIEYLEDAYPQHPLLPTDPEAKAQVRQIMRIAELYLELAARRLLPAVLANMPVADAVKDDVRLTLERGASSLTQLARFAPWVCGDTLTLADIYLRYALAIVKLAGVSQLQWDIFSVVPGLQDWDERMASDPISQRIDADQETNMAEFMDYVSRVSAQAKA